MRKLDILVPTFNRPEKLAHLLSSGLRLAPDWAHFVVIDDGSTECGQIPDIGPASTAEVCRRFKDPRVRVIRNDTNIGLAASLIRYYGEFCECLYTMLVNDKDEFIAFRPIANAVAKLDADDRLSIVMIPLRQIDRENSNRPLLFDYPRMTGREFLAHYIHDVMLQHAGGYGVVRVEALQKAGVPRSLDLRRYGLEDAFGVDIDCMLMLSTTGDVAFEREPHVRRSVIGGATERYPLSFAYCYYQYAKRAISDLRQRGAIEDADARDYVREWLSMIVRGAFLTSLPPDGITHETGTGRIRGHMKLPLFLYLLAEFLRQRVVPDSTLLRMGIKAAAFCLAFSLPSPIVKGMRAFRRRFVARSTDPQHQITSDVR